MEASTHPARTDFLQPAKGRKSKKKKKKWKERGREAEVHILSDEQFCSGGQASFSIYLAHSA